MLTWLSLDVATATGVAVWRGRELLEAFTLRPHPKGTPTLKAARWALDTGTGRQSVYASESDACPTTKPTPPPWDGGRS